MRSATRVQILSALLENLVWVGAAALLLVGVGALRTHSAPQTAHSQASPQDASLR